MKVLVTGATGFTGKALVRRMLDEGHRVVALDCQEGYKTAELHDWGAEVVIGSVTDATVVESAMRGVEIVHHVAAAFREIDGAREPLPCSERRGYAPAAAMRRSRQGVRKFVHCSTCGVHGNVDHPPADENAPIEPADYYQQSKYDAEPLVRDYVAKGLKSTILRPAAIFGPGDPGRFYMIFKQLSRRAGSRCSATARCCTTHSISTISSMPSCWRWTSRRVWARPTLSRMSEYMSIEELVRRTASAMGTQASFRRFPLWPVVAASHVVESLCKPFGISPPLYPRRVEWYQLTRAFSIEKARRELGYEPRVGVDEGLRRACEWYRREGMLA